VNPPAFPATGILDGFTGPDGGLGTMWVTPAFVVNAMTVVSNAVTSSAGAGSGAGWINTMPTNQEAWYTVKSNPTVGNAVYIDLRYDSYTTAGTMSGYQLKVTPSSGIWNIRRVDGGVNTVIGFPLSQAIVANDGIGFRAYANWLFAYYRSGLNGAWVLRGSADDTAYMRPGIIGLENNDNVVRQSLFGGGPVPDLIVATRRIRRNRTSW
jgi:hypothetical protein